MEQRLDPNRDFGYKQKPSKCMQSITARAVNELFRRHQFRSLITFHGGMRSLTYEWGSFNHLAGRKSTEAPDLAAQRSVGQALQDAAGKEHGRDCIPSAPTTLSCMR